MPLGIRPSTTARDRGWRSRPAAAEAGRRARRRKHQSHVAWALPLVQHQLLLSACTRMRQHAFSTDTSLSIAGCLSCSSSRPGDREDPADQVGIPVALQEETDAIIDRRRRKVALVLVLVLVRARARPRLPPRPLCPSDARPEAAGRRSARPRSCWRHRQWRRPACGRGRPQRAACGTPAWRSRGGEEVRRCGGRGRASSLRDPRSATD